MRTVLLSDYAIVSDFRLNELPNERTIVNTINAYSWVMADKDPLFRRALLTGDLLLPDGIAIVWAVRFLLGIKIRKVAGADLHKAVLDLLEAKRGKCFYLGASDSTLSKIRERLTLEYPHVSVETYSPPYKSVFSEEDNRKMIEAVNAFQPDVLFVGMTAPKQEKWVLEHATSLQTHLIGSIGAVFDFYAGVKQRPPQWMIRLGLEWFGRLVSDPKHTWKRYVVYNPVYVWKIFQLKWKQRKTKHCL